MKAILLVSPNNEELVSLASLFTRKGYIAILRCDGASALAILDQAAAVDVVISSYELPDMNGLDLTVRLNARSTNPPPVILLSDHVEVMAYLEAIGHGVFEFLFRPVHPAELLRIAGVARQVAQRPVTRNPESAQSGFLKDQDKYHQVTVARDFSP